jgi:hypothetical protein
MSDRIQRVWLLLSPFASSAVVGQYGCIPVYDPFGYGHAAMHDVIDYRWDVMDWTYGTSTSGSSPGATTGRSPS